MKKFVIYLLNGYLGILVMFGVGSLIALVCWPLGFAVTFFGSVWWLWVGWKHAGAKDRGKL